MKNIVGVRFKKLGKIYFFDPKKWILKKGDKVIVETAQGEEFGEIIIPNREVPDNKIEDQLKGIERIANNPIWAVSPVFTVFTTSTNF